MSEPHWTQDMFDEEYLRVWSFPGREASAAEVAGLLPLLPPPPGRLLDVACGTGRHAIALASAGYTVRGVDNSEVFLGVARAGALDAGVSAEFVLGDMRTLQDIERHDAVIVLGNSFGYHTDDENEGVLRAIAKVLRPGGTVVIELLNRDRIVCDHRALGGHIGPDGTRVELLSAFDPITGINTVTHRWMSANGDQIQRHSRQRLYTPPELAATCQTAGLQPVTWRNGFSAQPFERDARRLVLVAERM